MRARLGECVQVYTTNDLHLDEDPAVPIDHVNRLDGVFMNAEETAEVYSPWTKARVSIWMDLARCSQSARVRVVMELSSY